MLCGFFYSFCNSIDLLRAFIQIAIRSYFNHFSKDFLKEFELNDSSTKEVLDFLYVIALDLYKYHASNLKVEIFENLFDNLKPVCHYNVSSLKIVNKDFLEYLVSKKRRKNVYEGLSCYFKKSLL